MPGPNDATGTRVRALWRARAHVLSPACTEVNVKAFKRLAQRHIDFIGAQHLFFVGTAPLSADGHVNVSPKGYDSFSVINSARVAYLDLGGSGVETHAHVQENGRICIMFCAFEGKPLILRLYGHATAHAYGSPRFKALRSRFAAVDVAARGIIEVQLTRVQDSCGWGVPHYDFVGDRTRLRDHIAKSTEDAYIERRYQKNAASIDGLPGLLRPAAG